jgi:hypothetical protein
MRRSINAAGFVEVKGGGFFHPPTGAHLRVEKELKLAIVERITSRKDGRVNKRDRVRRKATLPRETVEVVHAGKGMADRLRKALRDAFPKIKEVCPKCLDTFSDRHRHSTPAHINRSRGGKARTRPGLKIALGWSPASFRADRNDPR